MVEIGPFIEFRCEPYVQVAYVERCVIIGLLMVVVFHVLVALIRRSSRS